MNSARYSHNARYRQKIEERPPFELFLPVTGLFFTSVNKVSGHNLRTAEICIEIMARRATWRTHKTPASQDRQSDTNFIFLG